MRTLALALAACAALAVLPAATGADRDRGMALYESRCNACHATSVHNRATRKAGNFAEVREWVMRWNVYLGSDWGPSEIDDVTRYVNEKFYGFPCPTDVCSAGT